jgi:hypothetical protein
MKTFSKIQKSAIITCIILLFSIVSSSQISITSIDMPAPGDEMLFGIRMQPGAAINGFANAGAGQTWNFSSITSDDEQLNRYISPTSSEIQFICIAVFNNPLDPAHDATVARPGPDMSDPMQNIQITNVFEFFKKSDSIFSMVGRSASVNGVPACVRTNPVDMIYRFPLNFGDTITSYSEFEIEIPTVGYLAQTLNRTSVADAWGTIQTPIGSFNALRIKSTLMFTDSIYYQSMGIGFKIPHTETHYTWLTNELRFPVFVIEDRGASFGGTVALWADTTDYTSVFENDFIADFQIFPNPARDQLTIQIHDQNLYETEISISELTGKIHKQIITAGATNTLSVTDLAPGIYIITVGKSMYRKKVIIY